MSRPVKPRSPHRPYRSGLRSAQAQETRQRIADAARELFVDQGYAATTIRAVADRAGVAEMTVYTAFDDKRGLLEALIRDAIGGPDYSPDPERFAEIEKLATPRERLRAWAALTCEILGRTSSIHAVIRGAADKEPFARDLRARLLSTRLETQREMLRRYLHGALRPGLAEHDAAERHCALTSPELHHLLTNELGWQPQRYATWLADLLEAELLDR